MPRRFLTRVRTEQPPVLVVQRSEGESGSFASGAPTASPHSVQNFALGRLDAPQAGQCRGKAVPQALQNFAASEF